MPVDYHAWTATVKRLHHALAALEPVARQVGVQPPLGEEWYELLVHKLLPQVEARPMLVVAVVGGTNIGKSLVFNLLAGEAASAVSPLAAGTKHPVCLTPEDFDDEATLERLFRGFVLLRWSAQEDPLEDCAEHRLFWRLGRAVPERLLLLDTPDIDSDAAVNWQRADTIRQSADVLIAVLTQQKYNDAAVKQFFRKAAEADKPVIIVFNQCDLEDDREYWPLWLKTFVDETGVSPELVYVIPYDRKAANELRLPFYGVGADGRTSPAEGSSLRDELAALHFDAIKIRTFRGAVAEVIDPTRGARGYLERVKQASGQFTASARALSTAEMARVHWPIVPSSLLVDEIRTWWDANRSAWSRGVHGFYRAVGQGVSWPLRAAWQAATGPAADPLVAFRAREREAIVEAVQKLLDELDRLRRVGNETLRPRLEALLTGNSRRDLLERVQAAHATLPALDDDYRTFLRSELDRWGRDNPRAISFLRSLDHVAAVARPAITVSLAVSGWILAGDLVGQTAVQVAGHTAGNLAAEAAIAGGITGGGEAVVSATGAGVKQAAAQLFRELQSRYAQSRADWLTRWLETELLGGLLADLRRGAEAPQSREFEEVGSAIEALRQVER